MPPRPARRFTMGDAMFLVAATAVGLAMARAYDPDFTAARPAGFVRRSWGAPACLTAPWAIALIGLRAAGPRERPRLLLRGPGMAACCALTLALLIATVLNVTHEIGRGGAGPGRASDRLFNSAWYNAADLIPWAIGGAWFTLWKYGGRAPLADWIERAGCAIGLYWCLNPLLNVAAPVIVRVFPSLD